MNPTASRSGRRGGLTVFLVLLAVCVGLLWQQERILDWYRLRGFQATPEIAEITTQTSMTPAARHLFYINRPALEEKSIFRQNCPDYEETIVIGCYQQGQRGIHLLKVDDPRLEGVEQVTAAHEMLHAAFERLSSRERRQVEAWLLAYASDGLTDQRIKDTLKSYETTEPGEQANEMYCIFGTEIGDLPAELEQHYARFFEDRTAVVGYAAAYQEAFTSRQRQITQFDSKLNELSGRIKTDTATLEAQRDELQRSEDDLNAAQRAGEIERYNVGVDRYNGQVNAYNVLLSQTRARIEEYNRLVIERNTIAEQTQELRQAIDSDELPQTR